MNRNQQILFLAMLFFLGSCQDQAHKNVPKQTVNAIIGDESFQQVFHSKPLPSSPESLRLTTHLAYVEQLLRSNTPKGLSAAQRENRKACLGHLKEYWMKGQFPVNSKYEHQRRPCFIDEKGNICAVGYLVEQTTGRAVAEKINDRYQYEYVMHMEMPLLNEWAVKNGFTKEELAMIQPAYGAPPPNQNADNYISPAAAAYSGAFNGVNLAANIISVANLNNPNMPQAVPIVGLVAGSFTTAMGISALSREDGGMSIHYPTPAEKTLGTVNIAMGTTTLLLNTYALINNHRLRKHNINVQSFTYQTTEQTTGVGLKLVKRF